MLEQMIELLTETFEGFEETLQQIESGDNSPERIEELRGNLHNAFMLLAEEGLIRPKTSYSPFYRPAK